MSPLPREAASTLDVRHGRRTESLAGFPACAKGKPAQALYLRTFGKVERVFYINAEVANCALDLRVAKQNLNSAQVSRRLVDDRRLRRSECVP